MWSSKLHEVLQPRTHILMEPEATIYSQFLKPLVEKKDSTYKLIPESGMVWDNLERLMAGELLQHQERFQPNDPRLEQPNDSLLFVANLGHYPRKAFQGFRSVATLTIHQLLAAIRTHALFQCYGQVRMLIWLQDKEKIVILPRMISLRTKFSVDAEVSCGMINEVAGSDTPPSSFRRETALDLESAKAVRNRMKEARIETPPSRIGPWEAKAALDTNEGEKALITANVWTTELADLERRHALKEFAACYDEDGMPMYNHKDEKGHWKALDRRYERTALYKRMKRLQWNLAQVGRKAELFEVYINEYQGIMDELVVLQNDDSVEAQSKRDDATERLRNWREIVEEGLADNHGERILHFIEDRRSLRQDPPLLLWDRRQAEPLMTRDADFFPEYEMCLLDFQPKSIWPIVGGKNIRNYDFFDFMISSLFHIPTQSLITGLKALAPGAAEWILPRCPSLTNPAKGGVANISELTVRSLTQEMMREIMEGWMDWPFRPTKAAMMARMDSNVDDRDIEGKDP